MKCVCESRKWVNEVSESRWECCGRGQSSIQKLEEVHRHGELKHDKWIWTRAHGTDGWRTVKVPWLRHDERLACNIKLYFMCWRRIRHPLSIDRGFAFFFIVPNTPRECAFWRYVTLSRFSHTHFEHFRACFRYHQFFLLVCCWLVAEQTGEVYVYIWIRGSVDHHADRQSYEHPRPRSMRDGRRFILPLFSAFILTVLLSFDIRSQPHESHLAQP